MAQAIPWSGRGPIRFAPCGAWDNWGTAWLGVAWYSATVFGSRRRGLDEVWHARRHVQVHGGAKGKGGAGGGGWGGGAGPWA